MEQKIYQLRGGKTPLSCLIAVKHTHRKPLLWFDEKEGVQRALRYSTNQRSVFEDEQDGHVVMGAVEFKDGMLICDTRRHATLIEFLEHHPDNVMNGGRVFELRDKEKEAEEIIDLIEMESEAVSLAREVASDVEELEKLGYMIFGAKTRKMKTAELKRDVLIYARNNPKDFLELFDDVDAENDALVTKAVAEGYIQWRKNNTELYWNLKDSKKMIFRAKRGEDHMKEFDKFLGTPDGVEVYETLKELVR
jgi:hypothetical protein